MSKDKLDSKFEQFVEQLTENTTLTNRQAEVYTLRKSGYKREQVTELLEISEGAVDSHYSKARDKVTVPASNIRLHFYKSYPLLWEEKTITRRQTESYVVSKPLTHIRNYPTTDIEPDTKFFTIYNGMKLTHPSVLKVDAAQHIPFHASNSQTLYQTVEESLERPLGEDAANLLSNLYTTYGNKNTNPEDNFIKQVLKKDSLESATNEFYGTLDNPLRYEAFKARFKQEQLPSVHTGFGSLTQKPITLDTYTNKTNWLSIVGDIGSGKTYTKDIIFSQITQDSSATVVNFNPLNTTTRFENAESNVLGFYASDDIDACIDDFCETVFEVLDESESEPVYIVIDEAHYVTNANPEAFSEFVTAAEEDESVFLITATQTIREFLETDELSELVTTPVWLFHRLQGVPKSTETIEKDTIPDLVPDEVSNLSVGTSEEPYSEAILNDGEETPLRFRVAVTPSVW